MDLLEFQSILSSDNEEVIVDGLNKASATILSQHNITFTEEEWLYPQLCLEQDSSKAKVGPDVVAKPTGLTNSSTSNHHFLIGLLKEYIDSSPRLTEIFDLFQLESRKKSKSIRRSHIFLLCVILRVLVSCEVSNLDEHAYDQVFVRTKDFFVKRLIKEDITDILKQLGSGNNELMIVSLIFLILIIKAQPLLAKALSLKLNVSSRLFIYLISDNSEDKKIKDTLKRQTDEKEEILQGDIMVEESENNDDKYDEEGFGCDGEGQEEEEEEDNDNNNEDDTDVAMNMDIDLDMDIDLNLDLNLDFHEEGKGIDSSTANQSNKKVLKSQTKENSNGFSHDVNEYESKDITQGKKSTTSKNVPFLRTMLPIFYTKRHLSIAFLAGLLSSEDIYVKLLLLNSNEVMEHLFRRLTKDIPQTQALILVLVERCILIKRLNTAQKSKVLTAARIDSFRRLLINENTENRISSQLLHIFRIILLEPIMSPLRTISKSRSLQINLQTSHSKENNKRQRELDYNRVCNSKSHTISYKEEFTHSYNYKIPFVDANMVLGTEGTNVRQVAMILCRLSIFDNIEHSQLVLTCLRKCPHVIGHFMRLLRITVLEAKLSMKMLRSMTFLVQLLSTTPILLPQSLTEAGSRLPVFYIHDVDLATKNDFDSSLKNCAFEGEGNSQTNKNLSSSINQKKKVQKGSANLSFVKDMFPSLLNKKEITKFILASNRFVMRMGFLLLSALLDRIGAFLSCLTYSDRQEWENFLYEKHLPDLSALVSVRSRLVIKKEDHFYKREGKGKGKEDHLQITFDEELYILFLGTLRRFFLHIKTAFIGFRYDFSKLWPDKRSFLSVSKSLQWEYLQLYQTMASQMDTSSLFSWLGTQDEWRKSIRIFPRAIPEISTETSKMIEEEMDEPKTSKNNEKMNVSSATQKKDTYLDIVKATKPSPIRIILELLLQTENVNIYEKCSLILEGLIEKQLYRNRADDTIAKNRNEKQSLPILTNSKVLTLALLSCLQTNLDCFILEMALQLCEYGRIGIHLLESKIYSDESSKGRTISRPPSIILALILLCSHESYSTFLNDCNLEATVIEMIQFPLKYIMGQAMALSNLGNEKVTGDNHNTFIKYEKSPLSYVWNILHFMHRFDNFYSYTGDLIKIMNLLVPVSGQRHQHFSVPLWQVLHQILSSNRICQDSLSSSSYLFNSNKSGALMKAVINNILSLADEISTYDTDRRKRPQKKSGKYQSKSSVENNLPWLREQLTNIIDDLAKSPMLDIDLFFFQLSRLDQEQGDLHSTIDISTLKKRKALDMENSSRQHISCDKSCLYVELVNLATELKYKGALSKLETLLISVLSQSAQSSLFAALEPYVVSENENIDLHMDNNKNESKWIVTLLIENLSTLPCSLLLWHFKLFINSLSSGVSGSSKRILNKNTKEVIYHILRISIVKNRSQKSVSVYINQESSLEDCSLYILYICNIIDYSATNCQRILFENILEICHQLIYELLFSINFKAGKTKLNLPTEITFNRVITFLRCPTINPFNEQSISRKGETHQSESMIDNLPYTPTNRLILSAKTLTIVLDIIEFTKQNAHINMELGGVIYHLVGRFFDQILDEKIAISDDAKREMSDLEMRKEAYLRIVSVAAFHARHILTISKRILIVRHMANILMNSFNIHKTDTSTDSITIGQQQRQEEESREAFEKILKIDHSVEKVSYHFLYMIETVADGICNLGLESPDSDKSCLLRTVVLIFETLCNLLNHYLLFFIQRYWIDKVEKERRTNDIGANSKESGKCSQCLQHTISVLSLWITSCKSYIPNLSKFIKEKNSTLMKFLTPALQYLNLASEDFRNNFVSNGTKNCNDDSLIYEIGWSITLLLRDFQWNFPFCNNIILDFTFDEERSIPDISFHSVPLLDLIPFEQWKGNCLNLDKVISIAISYLHQLDNMEAFDGKSIMNSYEVGSFSPRRPGLFQPKEIFSSFLKKLFVRAIEGNLSINKDWVSEEYILPRHELECDAICYLIHVLDFKPANEQVELRNSPQTLNEAVISLASSSSYEMLMDLLLDAVPLEHPHIISIFLKLIPYILCTSENMWLAKISEGVFNHLIEKTIRVFQRHRKTLTLYTIDLQENYPLLIKYFSHIFSHKQRCLKKSVDDSSNYTIQNSSKYFDYKKIRYQIELGLCVHKALHPWRESRLFEGEDESGRYQELFDTNLEFLESILQNVNEDSSVFQNPIDGDQIIQSPSLLQYLVNGNALVSFIDLMDHNLRVLHQYSSFQKLPEGSPDQTSTSDNSTYLPESIVFRLQDFLFANHNSRNCLISFYNGSCSTVDTKILSLFHQYERLAQINIVPCLLHFGSQISPVNDDTNGKSIPKMSLAGNANLSDKINSNVLTKLGALNSENPYGWIFGSINRDWVSTSIQHFPTFRGLYPQDLSETSSLSSIIITKDLAKTHKNSKEESLLTSQYRDYIAINSNLFKNDYFIDYAKSKEKDDVEKRGGGDNLDSEGSSVETGSISTIDDSSDEEGEDFIEDDMHLEGRSKKKRR